MINLHPTIRKLQTHLDTTILDHHDIELFSTVISSLNAIEVEINNLNVDLSHLRTIVNQASPSQDLSIGINVARHDEILRVLISRQEKFEKSLDKLCDVIFSNLDRVQINQNVVLDTVNVTNNLT